MMSQNKTLKGDTIGRTWGVLGPCPRGNVGCLEVALGLVGYSKTKNKFGEIRMDDIKEDLNFPT